LLEDGIADQTVIDQINSDVEKEAEEALNFALEAPYPDESEVDQHVYA
jgi:pyruvate dehydrogenase E1 component alpha subunit